MFTGHGASGQSVMQIAGLRPNVRVQYERVPGLDSRIIADALTEISAKLGVLDVLRAIRKLCYTAHSSLRDHTVGALQQLGQFAVLLLQES